MTNNDNASLFRYFMDLDDDEKHAKLNKFFERTHRDRILFSKPDKTVDEIKAELSALIAYYIPYWEPRTEFHESCYRFIRGVMNTQLPIEGVQAVFREAVYKEFNLPERS